MYIKKGGFIINTDNISYILMAEDGEAAGITDAGYLMLYPEDLEEVWKAIKNGRKYYSLDKE